MRCGRLAFSGPIDDPTHFPARAVRRARQPAAPGRVRPDRRASRRLHAIGVHRSGQPHRGSPRIVRQPAPSHPFSPAPRRFPGRQSEPARRGLSLFRLCFVPDDPDQEVARVAQCRSPARCAARARRRRCVVRRAQRMADRARALAAPHRHDAGRARRAGRSRRRCARVSGPCAVALPVPRARSQSRVENPRRAHPARHPARVRRHLAPVRRRHARALRLLRRAVRADRRVADPARAEPPRAVRAVHADVPDAGRRAMDRRAARRSPHAPRRADLVRRHRRRAPRAGNRSRATCWPRCTT